VLQVSEAPYQLPFTVSREVVVPAGRDVLILGGLNAQSASTETATMLDPVTGATRADGHLASPVHDAAGAVLGGRSYVFGGGSASTVRTVQAITAGGAASAAGQLPGPRSDVSAVTAGSTAYLVGGYDGTSYDPGVLATTDGTHFRTVARLSIPVRYAAVAAAGTDIWVFGGETRSGPTSAIQQIDLTTGKTAVVGNLPSPVEGASAVNLGGRVFVAGGQTAGSPGDSGGAGGPGRRATSRSVWSFDPVRGAVTSAGQLPVPAAYAGVAVAGGTAYLVGGSNGQRDVPTVTTLRMVPPSAAVTPSNAASAPWLAPASGAGQLAAGSDPSVLPGDVLIADHQNNRLIIVDPRGRIRWEFPRRGDLAAGQTFRAPDDAFFSPDGKYIIATQEDDYVISVIDVATSKIVYRYGTPGSPGAGPDQLFNPDDAMLTPAGRIIAADIKNCRIVMISPPAHSPGVIGRTTNTCMHDPPARFGSPNGAFPLTDGRYLVTEINGNWVDEMSLTGKKVAWSARPPGVSYPSDTNEVYPGRYLTADYSDPGQVVEFDASGRLLWRLGGFNQPSLALPLPNGDILLNDDFGHRVVVADPRTNRIVWQYGHTGAAGQGAGYLSDPDGVDLVPPDSLLITHAGTMGEP
jgi:N-acetylneuraminic acid mutarotase